MAEQKILSDADLARAREARLATLGDDLRKPEVWRVGRVNADGTITVPVENPEVPGMVYVRRQGDNVGSAVHALWKGEPIDANAFVEVKPYKGFLRIVDIAPENANRRAGIPLRPQAPISLSQFDYGLLRPTNPPSLECVISEALYEVGGDLNRVGNMLTKDFTADLPGSDAIGILIELDPATATLYYTSSTGFDASLSLLEAFDDYLPVAITEGRYSVGYVKLYTGQTGIRREDILPAQQVFAKGGSGGTTFDPDTIVTFEGQVVTHNGNVVTHTPEE